MFELLNNLLTYIAFCSHYHPKVPALENDFNMLLHQPLLVLGQEGSSWNLEVDQTWLQRGTWNRVGVERWSFKVGVGGAISSAGIYNIQFTLFACACILLHFSLTPLFRTCLKLLVGCCWMLDLLRCIDTFQLDGLNTLNGLDWMGIISKRKRSRKRQLLIWCFKNRHW